MHIIELTEENIYKKCSKCNSLLPLTSFTFHKEGKYSKRPDCKKCVKLRAQKKSKRIYSITTEKECFSCKKVLTLDNFDRQYTGKYGRTSRCKECMVEYNKKRKENLNKEEYPVTLTKICTSCKKDLPLFKYGKATKGKYGRKPRCLECMKKQEKERTHKEYSPYLTKICSCCKKEVSLVNFYRDISGKYGRQIFCKKCCNNKREDRRKDNFNITQQISKNISVRMRISLNKGKKKAHWEDLVEYSKEELYLHLKNTLPEDYIMEDYKEGKLQLDHIKPVASYCFTSTEDLDFKECWSLENLRLIETSENHKKAAKWGNINYGLYRRSPIRINLIN